MTTLQLAGPSYALRNRKADVQRRINWCPVQIESGTGQGGSPAYLKQAPGKVALHTFAGVVRGVAECRGVLYAVAANKLYSVASDWTTTELGTLSTSTGRVSMEDNQTQLAIADGSSTLYVYDLDSGAFTSSVGNYTGSKLVQVLDGYGLFCQPGTPTFYWTGIQDFTSINSTNQLSEETSTGNIVAILVKHRELIVLSERTGTVWYPIDNPIDIPFARNGGAIIEVGCVATHSLQKLNGTAIWLGKNQDGGVCVYAMQAYTPQRISNHALEELLGAIPDLSGAYAWVANHEGLSYYVLQVPGLSSTWVWEMASGIWHERAEFIAGEFERDYADCHAYCYGYHVVGGSDGILYKLDPTHNKSGTRVMARGLVSPHNASPSASMQTFGSAQVVCNVGGGLPSGEHGTLMLRYSNNGGRTWKNWRYLSTGAIGEYEHRVRATLLGAAKDRVWEIRVTDDCNIEPISMLIDEN